ncbi:MAG TPA: hypothetical protein VK053_08095 [Jiangellaceae bacterium]|nr:hypothetical protein [Jiangellaceae bacterium]
MTTLTVTIGGILTATGIIAYVVSGAASVTALIPSFVGILLLICALLARKPALHQHAIHAALVVAVLGAAGSLMNVAQIGDLFAGTAERPSAIVVSIIMFVLLVYYIAMGVRSFVTARRNRTATSS